ncbi:ABC transporter substrate-binding protein [Pseudonocardiaceae bacterium YIM PH 21723]|nr:ABC transporter substrate-binding protein [Pseudonocardiaceae bacterium YIM PH 21723]
MSCSPPMRGILLAVLAGLLTACGTPGTPGSPAIPDTRAILASVTKDPQLNAGLPSGISQAGTLKLASNIQSAPNNFYAADGKTPVGYEVDLAKAIGARLGLTVQHQDMAFGSLITSLQSGRIDLTMAAMNDTRARQEQIDFVDYFTSGITIMVGKGNPEGITGPDALCGKTVAVVQGTSHQKFAAGQSEKCAQAGKPTLTVTATDSDNQNQNQLRTQRVQAILNDLPSAVYISRTAGDGRFFEVVPGDPIDGGPYGIGVRKQNGQLAESVRKALAGLIADGTYTKILQAWGVERGAVGEAVLNGGR